MARTRFHLGQHPCKDAAAPVHLTAWFWGRKEVCGLAVHPSGRLALSTARDGVLRMWNLVKGRCQYKTNLAACGEAVEFSPSGGAYALACGRQVRGSRAGR